MTKILLDENGKALMSANGKVYKTEPIDLIELLNNNTLTSYSNDRITKVRDYIFKNCSSLTEIYLPNVTDLGSYTFQNCSNLVKVNISKVTSLKDYVFRDCYNLIEIDLSNITSIASHTFACSSQKKGKLTNVNLSKTKRISFYAFAYHSIKTIFAPVLTEVSVGTFGYLYELTEAKLPIVTKMSSNSFLDDKSLTDVFLGYEGLVTLDNTNAFQSAGTTQGYINVHVRSEYAEQYADATNWSSLIASGQIVIVGDYND